MRNQYTECNKPKWVKLEFEMLTFYLVQSFDGHKAG